MNLLRSISMIFVVIIGLGCSPADDPVRSKSFPSIATLAPNDVLEMTYEACHRVCVRGIVEFTGQVAKIEDRSIELTSDEIADLDDYFRKGRTPEEGWNCSLIIAISFAQKTDGVTTYTQEPLHYPCIFGNSSKIEPYELVVHLQRTPDEKPYWRLTPEERGNKSLLE